MRIQIINRFEENNIDFATKAGEKIYFVDNNIIYQMNIYKYSSLKRFQTEFTSPISGIYNISEIIILVFGNVVKFCHINFDTLPEKKEIRLKELPICHKKYKERIFALFNENMLAFISLERINYVKIEVPESTNCIFLDFSIIDDKIFLLSSNGDVFISEQLSYYATHLNFCKIDLFPGKSKKYVNIIVTSSLVFLSGASFYDVFNREKHYLVQRYSYEGSTLSIHNDGDNVFALEKGLMIINKSPELLLNAKIEHFIDGIAISNDKIYEIEESKDDYGTKEDINGMVLIKEFGHVYRTEKLLTLLNRFNIGSILNQYRDNLEAGEFEVRKELFRIYKTMFFDLKTLNDGFEEKISTLFDTSKNLAAQVHLIDLRNEKILKKQIYIKDKLDKILKNLKSEEGYDELAVKIVTLRENINNFSLPKIIKYKEILKAQNLILRDKIKSSFEL